MSKLKQIIERFVVQGEILEADQTKLPEGVLCRVKYPICNIDELNRNKRIYAREVWDLVLKDEDIIEKLKTRSMWMQEEHPEEGSATKTGRISGIVTGISLDEKLKKAFTINEVLDTPYGRIIDTLLKAKCGIGVSTRAEGELEEVDEDGEKHYRVVPDKYRLITVDFTADPSTLGTYPEDVERKVASEVKKGLADQTIDRKYAVAILESMTCKDAKCILEDIKKVSDQVKGEYQKDVDALVELLKNGKINHEEYVKKLEAIEKKYRHTEPPKATEKKLEEKNIKDMSGDELLAYRKEVEEFYAGPGVPGDAKAEGEKLVAEINAELKKKGIPTEGVQEMNLGFAKGTIKRLGKKKDLSDKEQDLLKKAKDFVASAPKEDLEAWDELEKITESVEEIYDLIKKELVIGDLKIEEEIRITGETPESVTLMIGGRTYEYFGVEKGILDKFKKMLEHGAKFNALHWLHKFVPKDKRYRVEDGKRTPIVPVSASKKSVKENVLRFDFETLFNQMKDIADVTTLDAEDKKALKESKTNVDFFKNVIGLLKKVREKSAIDKAEREIIEQNAEKRINDLEEKYAKDILEFNKKIADLNKQLADSKKSSVGAQKQIAEKTMEAVKKIYEKKMDELRAAFEVEKAKLIETHKNEIFQKTVVDLLVRESGLELPNEAIAILRHCKTKEEVETKISDFRFQLKEAILHPAGKFEVKVEENVEGVGSQPMLDTTKKLIKSVGKGS